MQDFEDKTEAPTLHRREEARRLGNIPRSAELSAAVLCLAAVLLLQRYGGGVAEAFAIILREAFGVSGVSGASAGRIGYLLGSAIAPLLLGMLTIAVLAHLVQIGFVFRFRVEPINPAKQFGKLFSGRSAAQLVVSLLKLVLIASVAYFAASGRITEIVSLQNRPVTELATAGAAIMIAVALRIAAVLLVLGVADYAWQRLRHERELRMTRREVKDEQKRHEGAPETKRRRRQAAANLAAVRLDRDVAGADIVVSGRDAAVAVRFDSSTMLAPRIAAKGNRAVASSIRECAMRHKITIVERESLARVLLRSTQAGQQVPDHLFAPVAEILAYAFELRRRTT